MPVPVAAPVSVAAPVPLPAALVPLPAALVPAASSAMTGIPCVAPGLWAGLWAAGAPAAVVVAVGDAPARLMSCTSTCLFCIFSGLNGHWVPGAVRWAWLGAAGRLVVGRGGAGWGGRRVWRCLGGAAGWRRGVTGAAAAAGWASAVSPSRDSCGISLPETRFPALRFASGDVPPAVRTGFGRAFQTARHADRMYARGEPQSSPNHYMLWYPVQLDPYMLRRAPFCADPGGGPVDDLGTGCGRSVDEGLGN